MSILLKLKNHQSPDAVFCSIRLIQIAEPLDIIKPQHLKNIGNPDTSFHIRPVIQAIGNRYPLGIFWKLVQ